MLPLVKRAKLVPTSTWQFTVDYPQYDQVLRLINAYSGEVNDTQFQENVSMTVRFKEEDVESFTSQLTELSAGKVRFVLISREGETPFPV